MKSRLRTASRRHTAGTLPARSPASRQQQRRSVHMERLSRLLISIHLGVDRCMQKRQPVVLFVHIDTGKKQTM